MNGKSLANDRIASGGGNIQEIVSYILSFLCYEREQAAMRVAYSADQQLLDRYDVLILPSGHLGKDIVLPDLAKPVVSNPFKHKYIIHTDIVYNAFFFLSRAEEVINTQRDEHGRFLARYSVLGRGSNLLLPLIDEYARLVLKCLNEPMPLPGYDRIYLTHDIDSLTRYRSLRGTLGGIRRGEWQQVLASWRDIHNDPDYTFPWLMEQDKQVSKAQPVYFVKMTRGAGFDYPQYNLAGRDYKRLNRWLLDQGAFTGIHNSYYDNIQQITLDRSVENPVVFQRFHYLRCSLHKMRALVRLGYTDDFSVGFADRAGFRLQTTRAVRWIDPEQMTLTPLRLHPLMIMDTTLSAGKYMHLSEDEAYYLCQQIIDKVRMHHGELNLLWHNSNLTPDSYHRSLYHKILKLI